MAATKTAEEGIARADLPVSDEWRALALETVRQIAQSRRTFTAPDVWEHLPLPESGNGYALGGVMRRAVGRGYIESTGEYVAWTPGKQSMSGHAQTAAVWRSRIFNPEPLPGQLSIGDVAE